MRSFGRISNAVSQAPAAEPARQMNLLFEDSRLEGLGAAERDKIISALAQILMQAAGLSVEELDDDKR